MMNLTKMKPTKMLLYGMTLTMLLVVITGCGGVVGSTTASMPATPEPEELQGDPEEGRAIFNGEKRIRSFVPCSTCHYVTPHRYPRLGPDLAGLSKRAGERQPGMSAAEYLRESIRYPDAYVVDGFPPSTMNQAYDDILTDEQVEDVIAYLLTL
jgi:mono/diheme cytochrome c family protein